MFTNYHECEFCSATFVSAKNLEKHNCKYKKRFAYITQNKKGIAAFSYYKKWLTLSGKSIKYIDGHTFIHSVNYNFFINFVDLCKDNGIPDVIQFIKTMISTKISPKHWTRKDVIEFFFEEYDLKGDPKKHISISIDTIIRISDALSCEPKEIFQILEPKEISLLIKTRKLSPWLLLNSKEFGLYLKNKASAQDREYIQKFINPKKWKEIILRDPKLKKAIEQIIQEFDL